MIVQVGLVYRRYQRWPKFEWVQAAFEAAGHEVTEIETVDQLSAADGFCDLIVFEHREPGPGRKAIVNILGKKHKSVWVYWWFDLFIGFEHQDTLKLYGPLAEVMDYVLVKEQSELVRYADLGIKALWSDQGCPEFLAPLRTTEPPKYDVCLFGSKSPDYQERRADVLALRDAGFSVCWAGDGGNVPSGVAEQSWCPADALPALVASAATCLCVDLRHDLHSYYSDRLWLACACGATVLRRQSPGLPKIPISVYANADELLSNVELLFKEEMLRKSLGEACFVAAQHNTYGHVISRWLNAIGFTESCLPTADRDVLNVSG